jgi:hypothetical protein
LQQRVDGSRKPSGGKKEDPIEGTVLWRMAALPVLAHSGQKSFILELPNDRLTDSGISDEPNVQAGGSPLLGPMSRYPLS